MSDHREARALESVSFQERLDAAVSLAEESKKDTTIHSQGSINPIQSVTSEPNAAIPTPPSPAPAPGTDITSKAVKAFSELCLPSKPSGETPFERAKALVSFLVHLPLDGEDMLKRLCDMMSFVYGDARKDIAAVLFNFACDDGAPAFERVYAATTLYNRAYYDTCYTAYETIVNDIGVKVDMRVESCRFLFISEQEPKKKIAQSCLVEIIENLLFPSSYRYQTIAGFMSKTGISTILNSTNVRIPQDEEFVYGLQIIFFVEEKNDVRFRILSGQCILDMERSTPEDKRMVIDELLKIARLETNPERVRADAADVVYRFGKDNERFIEDSSAATMIIREIGTTRKPGSSFIENVKTLYTDSENIHDEELTESALRFIELMMSSKKPIPPYAQIYTEIIRFINIQAKPNPQRRVKLFSALNRINLDTSTYSSKKATLPQITSNVWYRISQHKGDEVATLKMRFLDELEDMADTCGSGHATRLVNTLVGFEDALKLSFEAQIIGNIAGRLNARMRDSKDVERLTIGVLEDAPKADREFYMQFVKTNLVPIYDELFKEFVIGGFVSKKDFEAIYAKGVEKMKM